jgi:hypothetical protein
MSSDVYGKVLRNNSQVYPKILFQVDRMSEVESMTYSLPPHYSFNGYCLGTFDLRQNDYITDLNTNNPVTSLPKAYQITNIPESFPDNHMEFQCIDADRAAITR